MPMRKFFIVLMLPWLFLPAGEDID